MADREEKGCVVCRNQWLAGQRLPKLGVSYERHASLHYCDQCQTLWELNERYVDTIEEAEASNVYGKEIISRRTELHSHFEPQNQLENSLIESQRGRMPFSVFLVNFLESEIFVLCAGTVNNSFVPAQYERNGESYIATFTSLQRVRGVSVTHPHCLSLKTSELLMRISPDVGIVLNPGWDVGFELTASNLGGIRRDFLQC